MRFNRTITEIRGCLSALGLNPSCPVVEGELVDSVGEYDPNAPALITIKVGLTGQRLWRVVLHEYGHAFGLGHTKHGIMHYISKTDADFSPAPATERQKKLWCMELARAVLTHKGKQWRVK